MSSKTKSASAYGRLSATNKTKASKSTSSKLKTAQRLIGDFYPVKPPIAVPAQAQRACVTNQKEHAMLRIQTPFLAVGRKKAPYSIHARSNSLQGQSSLRRKSLRSPSLSVKATSVNLHKSSSGMNHCSEVTTTNKEERVQQPSTAKWAGLVALTAHSLENTCPSQHSSNSADVPSKNDSIFDHDSKIGSPRRKSKRSKSNTAMHETGSSSSASKPLQTLSLPNKSPIGFQSCVNSILTYNGVNASYQESTSASKLSEAVADQTFRRYTKYTDEKCHTNTNINEAQQENITKTNAAVKIVPNTDSTASLKNNQDNNCGEEDPSPVRTHEQCQETNFAVRSFLSSSLKLTANMNMSMPSTIPVGGTVNITAPKKENNVGASSVASDETKQHVHPQSVSSDSFSSQSKQSSLKRTISLLDSPTSTKGMFEPKSESFDCNFSHTLPKDRNNRPLTNKGAYMSKSGTTSSSLPGKEIAEYISSSTSSSNSPRSTVAISNLKQSSSDVLPENESSDEEPFPTQDSTDALLCAVNVEALEASKPCVVTMSPNSGESLVGNCSGVQNGSPADFTSREPKPDTNSAPCTTSTNSSDDHGQQLQRFRVLEVNGDFPEKRLIIMGISPSVKTLQRSCILRDEWARTDSNVGDIVEIIGEFDTSGTCTISASSNFLILHPDILVATTRVATSFQCLRRAVLSEHFRASDVTTPAMVYGTLLHMVFQAALQADNFSRKFLQGCICRTISEQLDMLFAIGVSQAKAQEELFSYVNSIQEWSMKYRRQDPVHIVSLDTVNNREHEDKICITDVTDIEETCWSPRFGLKANIDATVSVTIHRRKLRHHSKDARYSSASLAAKSLTFSSLPESVLGHGQRTGENNSVQEGYLSSTQRQAITSAKGAACQPQRASVQDQHCGPDSGNLTQMLMPLEVKTGKSTTNGAPDHRAQVILYALVMNELGYNTSAGLLYYMKSGDMYGVPLFRPEVIALVMARNSLAKYIRLGTVYPPVLQRESICSRCYHINLCTAVHASMEDGTVKSFGLDEFSARTEHLQSRDLTYFKEWLELIALEDQVAVEEISNLWQTSSQMQALRHQGVACLTIFGVRTPNGIGSGAFSASTSTQVQGDQCNEKMAEKTTLENKYKQDHDLQQYHDLVSIESSRASAMTTTTTSTTIHPIDIPSVAISITGIKSFLYAFGRHSGSGLVEPVPISPFQYGDHVIISTEDPYHTTVRTGTVVGSDIYYIVIAVDQPVRQITRADSPEAKISTYRLDRDPSVYTGRTYRGHLFSLFGSNLPVQRQRYQPKSQSTQLQTDAKARRRELLIGLSPPVFREHVNEVELKAVQEVANFFGLNELQKQAVIRALCAVDYCLIQGMPGTGKTTTIACLLAVLVELGMSVLLTAFTHSAVDNVLLKLHSRMPNMILRLGSLSRIHPDLRSLSVDYAQAKHKSCLEGLSASYFAIPVIATTCLGLGHPVLSARQFDFCVVDEASQINQAACLGPLAFAKRFVLVGDHLQLPPLVRSAAARKKGMDISLFKRLAIANSHATTVLSQQYRMCEEIMQVANGLTYENRLTCGVSTIAKLRLPVPPLVGEYPSWMIKALCPNQPVVFLNTSDLPDAQESYSDKTIFNIAEARLASQLCHVLINSLALPQRELGLIVPYRAQLRYVEESIQKEYGLREIECNTVDRYQGRDKSCIIVSFVRSNRENSVGDILQDSRRINVAVTRAKAKLILIGCACTLKASEPLRNLIKLGSDGGWLIPVS